MFKAGDVGYSDMVNRTDRLDHMVIRTADIMKHKIQEPKHEVHYATMGRRRLPQEGARRIPRAHVSEDEDPELELEEGELREDDDFPAPIPLVVGDDYDDPNDPTYVPSPEYGAASPVAEFEAPKPRKKRQRVPLSPSYQQPQNRVEAPPELDLGEVESGEIAQSLGRGVRRFHQ